MDIPSGNGWSYMNPEGLLTRRDQGSGVSVVRIVLDFLRNARIARSKSRRAVVVQFIEALLLRLPPGRLGLSEYHDYQLYRSELTFAEKRRFVGWRGEPDLDCCNDIRWHKYADDKVLFDGLLAAEGLPRPILQAVFDSNSETGPSIERLSTPEELQDWLQTRARFPLFVKPSHAGFGRGTYLIKDYRQSDDKLILDDGSTVDAIRFAAELPNPEGRGVLFQSLLRPHMSLSSLCCGRLSTLRMMVLVEPDTTPVLYRAVWKIPRQFNIIDNFESGTTGNLLGQVDLNEGIVRRVVQGYGIFSLDLLFHPDSGLPFSNLQIPDWPESIKVTLTAAHLMPEFRFQHWDVALTDHGPVLVEVNLFAAGGTELSQLVDGIGLLEPRLLAVNRPWQTKSAAG